MIKTAWKAGPYYQDSQFNVQWAQRTIIDLLTAYKHDFIAKIASNNSEKDIITRIWRMIDTVFDDTGITAIRYIVVYIYSSVIDHLYVIIL